MFWGLLVCVWCYLFWLFVGFRCCFCGFGVVVVLGFIVFVLIVVIFLAGLLCVWMLLVCV